MKIGHLGNGKTLGKTVYSIYDTSPTLIAGMSHGNVVPYIVVRGGRMKVLGHLLDSSNQRYVVYDKEQDAPTLQAAMGTGGGNVPYITDRGGQRIVAMRGRDPQNPSDRTSGNPNLEQRLEANSEGICNTLTTVQKDNMVLDEEMGIRKLTPRESWRLMDFSDEDFDKAAKVNSQTQLYKQAGNSIVQNVLVAVMGQLFEGKENIYKERSENGTRPTASEPICVNSKSGRGGAKDYSLPYKTECIGQTDAPQQ